MKTKTESEDNSATQDLENAETDLGDTNTTNVISESNENLPKPTETGSLEPSVNLSMRENIDSVMDKATDNETNTTNDLSESTEIKDSHLGELIQSEPGKGEMLLGAMNTQVPVCKKIRGKNRRRKPKIGKYLNSNQPDNRTSAREASRNSSSDSRGSVQSQKPSNHNPGFRISVRRRKSLYENPESGKSNSVTDSSQQQNLDPRASNTKEQSRYDSDRVTRETNPLKRKRVRPLRSKRKLQRLPTPEVPQVKEETPSVEFSVDSQDDVEYCLTVSNLPKSMSFMEIKNYFDTEVGPLDEIELIKDNKTGFGAIRLSYQTENECKEAQKKLEGKVVAGNKIVLEMSVVSMESDTETSPEPKPDPESETNPGTAVVLNKPWKPDLDSWEVDHKGMYGLKLQYLKSLGITPPIDKWVHVSNFRCDKSELRDILEMAGNVQMCSIFTISNRYANVMYSHPLEAVQAVAMLNKQKLYGQELKVAMDRSPADTILLPKGLSSIGSGLGLNGKPLRNILKHYERFLDNKECLISPVAFNVKEDYSVKNNVKFVVKNVEEFNYQIPSEVKAPAAPTIIKQTPPKPIQISAPKPEVQTPAYTQQPVLTSQAQNRTYNAAYSTFVAPQSNGGPKQITVSSQMQNTGPIRPGPMPGPVAQGQMGPRPIGPALMGTGPMGPQLMGQGLIGSGPMGQGPVVPAPMGQGPMGQGPIGQGPMGQRPMGQGPMGQGPMGPRLMDPRLMRSGLMGSGPMGQGPMGPGPMSGLGPTGHGPMVPGPMGPGPMGQQAIGPGQMVPTGSFNNEPVKMILRNLPPSTTFAILCEKMSEWGHVVCLQLTTPGCAVVTFGNRMQADACFHHYNGRNIDNHIIQMHYA